MNDFHEFKLGSNTPKFSAQLGYIFAPIGNPEAFFRLLIGIGLTYLGILFITANGDYSHKKLYLGKLIIISLIWIIVLSELFVNLDYKISEIDLMLIMNCLFPRIWILYDKKNVA